MLVYLYWYIYIYVVLPPPKYPPNATTRWLSTCREEEGQDDFPWRWAHVHRGRRTRLDDFPWRWAHVHRGKRTRRLSLKMARGCKRYRLMAKLSRLPSIELMLPEMSPIGWCGKRKAYFCSARRQAIIFCSPRATRANVLFFVQVLSHVLRGQVSCTHPKIVAAKPVFILRGSNACTNCLVPAFTCWLRRTLFFRKRHALSMCCVPDLTFKIFPLATLWVVTRTYWGAAQVTLPRIIRFFLQWTTASCSTPLTLVR